MRDRQVAMPVTVPPFQLDHIAKAKVSHQIEHMLWHDNGGRGAPKLFCVLDQRPQRRSMQVVEVRMSDEHEIDWRQVPESNSRLSQSLQHKKPAREIGIDQDILATHLQEKAGVSNESHTHLAIGYQDRLVRLSNSRCHCRAPYQASELPGALAHRGTLDGLSKHKKLLAPSH